MRTITKLSLLLAIALPVAALAGPGAAPPGRPGMAKLDTNGDGKIDDAERAAARAARDKRRAAMLAEFDTNKDGTLDDAERTAMHRAMSDRAFAALDTNGDGVLSKDEFAAGHPGRFGGMHRGHHRGPGGPDAPDGDATP